jgi:hypothetical protein
MNVPDIFTPIFHIILVVNIKELWEKKNIQNCYDLNVNLDLVDYEEICLLFSYYAVGSFCPDLSFNQGFLSATFYLTNTVTPVNAINVIVQNI